MDATGDPISFEVISVLQLRTTDDPWLPRLESFECEEATEEFIPLFPLVLSPRTTEIRIHFAWYAPVVLVASTIARLPKLCPDLESITLDYLPRDPAITEAVSEMLIACKRDTLRTFDVGSPLTEEAREVVYRLPKLSSLCTFIQGTTSLPTVTLPNLTAIDVKYNDDLNWLQGFRGAVFGQLDSATFRSGSNSIGDLIGAFESVALTTSAKDTLRKFRFHNSRNPNYSALLSFHQLKEVEIEYSCHDGCCSRVDDEITMRMARAMPKLEILKLGGMPCETPTGVTVNGFIGLARLCPHLSKLRIHFQAASLVEAATSTVTLSPSDNGTVVRRKDCALVDLEVGGTPIPARSDLTVALVLVQIFPRLRSIGYVTQEWNTVAETIKDFRRIGAFIHRSGKAHTHVY